jgi:chromosome segregation ATPase
MTDHPSADAARIREIRNRLKNWRKHACNPRGDQDFVKIFEVHSADDIGYLLDALTRSEQARQDMEIERDAAQDQCAGAERFGREQELRAVTAEQARQEAEQQIRELRIARIGDSENIGREMCRAERAEAALANMTADRDALARDHAAVSQERDAANEAFTRAHGALVKLRAERERLREVLTTCDMWARCDLEMHGPGPADGYSGRVEYIAAALATTPPSQEPT